MKRLALLPYGGDDDAGPLELTQDLDGEGDEGLEDAADGDAVSDVGEFSEATSHAVPLEASARVAAAPVGDTASDRPADITSESGENQTVAALNTAAASTPAPAAAAPSPVADSGQGDEPQSDEAPTEYTQADEPQEEEGQGEGEALLPLDPVDLADLRRWLRLELASELERSGVLHPLLVELDPEDKASVGSSNALPDAGTLSDIAGAAGLEFAAAASIDSGWGAVRVRLLVAAAEGDETLQQQAVASYEELASVPQALARAVLLAIGEEAAAPAPPDERPVPIDALLLLCRASRQLEEAQQELERAAEEPAATPSSLPEATVAAAGADGDPAAAAELEPLRPPLRPSAGDPSAALENLLDSLSIDPDFAPPRTLLLEEAEHAASGPWMPAFFAALDRLAALRPADLEASLALGDYRRLHFDEEGARELYLDVRDRAEAVEDGPLYAMASERLAALASEAGRAEEAVAHLRAAVRFADDPALYLKLGVLLREFDPVESMRALQRALALDKSPRARLELGRSLLLVDEGERALAELSKASQGSARDPEAAAEASDLLRVILLSAGEAPQQ